MIQPCILSIALAIHLAGIGVQVLIYMGQMQSACGSVGGRVDVRCGNHTDFHLQQKIEYKSGEMTTSKWYF